MPSPREDNRKPSEPLGLRLEAAALGTVADDNQRQLGNLCGGPEQRVDVLDRMQPAHKGPDQSTCWETEALPKMSAFPFRRRPMDVEIDAVGKSKDAIGGHAAGQQLLSCLAAQRREPR
jgi:hypothetical protein